MIRFSCALVLAMVCSLINAGFAQTELNVLKIKNARQFHAYFKYTGNDIPLINGHRGGMVPGFPENSIETFENTLRHTPAFFEVDPRLTKDSVIVLMHDATLERTTNGKGKVSDYTWQELQKLRLRDPEGNVTESRIPTLEEAVKWARGKTILDLDKKDVPLEMTARKLTEWNAWSHVMLTVHNAEQAKFYCNYNKNVMLAAFVKTKEALYEYEKAGIPWSQVMAFIGTKTGPENKELIDMLHQRGVMCMISAAPTYDKLKDPEARKEAYREIVKSGADVIESDLPIEAAEAIRPLIKAKSGKSKFFAKSAVK